MSSDYSINKEDLVNAGVKFTFLQYKIYSEDMEMVAKFPDYPYSRDVEEDSEGNIMISCAGTFRNWLDNYFLYESEIRFVKM